jgi:hypothetical protein
LNKSLIIAIIITVKNQFARSFLTLLEFARPPGDSAKVPLLSLGLRVKAYLIEVAERKTKVLRYILAFEPIPEL